MDKQKIVAGLIMILFGLILEGKPSLIWKIAESWKSKDAHSPSEIFNLVCRIIGCVWLIIGMLLVAGLIG